MTYTPHPQWIPASYTEAARDIERRPIEETHYQEFKRKLERPESIAKVLAQLANDGGVLHIGIDEDKETARATAITPVRLEGQVERILEIARSLDPPLYIEQPAVLANPDDPAEGIIVVRVPVSPVAPHQTPDRRYHGRNHRTSYPMSDAEVERLMRQREERSERVSTMLAETVKDLSRGDRGFTPSASLACGSMTIVAEPVPVRDRHLLRRQLGNEANWRSWLDEHVRSATDGASARLIQGQGLTGMLPSGWSPFRGTLADGRTTTGVERQSTGRGNDPEIPVRGVVQLDETGAARVSQNHIIYPPRSDDRRVLAWPYVVAGALWTLALLDSITGEIGYRTDVAIAIHVDLMNTVPDELTNDTEAGHWRRGRLTASQREPYPGAEYRETTVVSLAELGGDPRGPLDRLFGRLLRGMGLGDLLAPPAP